MSRPSRIHDRRASSRRRPVDSATAVARPPARPGGSSTTRSVSARRASAASRPSRSAIRAGLVRGGQPATGQVEDEQVDRAPGQQRATDGQPLVERLGGDDHEPFEPDAAGDRLDRVEAAREVEPGDDRAGGLGLGGEPEDERRPAARAVAADRDAGRPWQAARPQDGVERREAGVDDAVVRVEPWLWNECRGRVMDAGARAGAGASASAPSVVQLTRWVLLDGVLATGAFAARAITFGREGQERPWRSRSVPVSTSCGAARTVLDRMLLDGGGAGRRSHRADRVR